MLGNAFKELEALLLVKFPECHLKYANQACKGKGKRFNILLEASTVKKSVDSLEQQMTMSSG